MASDLSGDETLFGQRFIITGAAGGIGSALAHRLAARGAHLVLAGRRREPLDELGQELGGSSEVHEIDAADFGAVEALVKQVSAEGGVQGAANCVGSIVLKPAHLTSEEEFAQTLRQNLGSAFALVRAMGRFAARQETGAAVALVSTVAARIGLSNHEAIAAAKAGVEGLVRAAAATYAPVGIRVNAVAPSLTDTPLAARITQNERALEASKAMHPLGRIGTPGEIAQVLEWLLAPDGSWVTGQVISVDGGLSTVRRG